MVNKRLFCLSRRIQNADWFELWLETHMELPVWIDLKTWLEFCFKRRLICTMFGEQFRSLKLFEAQNISRTFQTATQNFGLSMANSKICSEVRN